MRFGVLQNFLAGFGGVGHIRLNQVREDYAKRLEYDDWDYTPGHHPGKGGDN